MDDNTFHRLSGSFLFGWFASVEGVASIEGYLENQVFPGSKKLSQHRIRFN